MVNNWSLCEKNFGITSSNSGKSISSLHLPCKIYFELENKQDFIEITLLTIIKEQVWILIRSTAITDYVQIFSTDDGLKIGSLVWHPETVKN